MVTRQFIRLHVTISILVVTTGSAGGISAEKSGLELGPCFDTDAWRGFKLWQLQKGGWPVCDPVLRLAGAAYGGSKETFTTMCGDESRCVVCNLRKAGCSLIAYCCTTVCGDDRQVCCVQFAENRLFAICRLL